MIHTSKATDFKSMNRLSTDRRTQVISALVEGVSINATARMTGVAKHTILKLLKDMGCACSAPPVEAVKKLYPQERITVGFPPKRFSSELAMEAHAYFNIYESKFRQSRLPIAVTLASGVQVECPSKWR